MQSFFVAAESKVSRFWGAFWDSPKPLPPPPKPPEINWTLCLGVTAAALAAVSFFFIWSRKLMAQMEGQLQNIAQENQRTKAEQYEQLMLYAKDLKSKNNRLAEEIDNLSKRRAQTESSMHNLIAALSAPPETGPSQTNSLLALDAIYREQITALREENDALKQQYQQLRREQDCSICTAQEPNCLLRPCGHTMCTECFYEIQTRWYQNQGRYDDAGGMPCPFCRAPVTEMIPKFRP